MIYAYTIITCPDFDGSLMLKFSNIRCLLSVLLSSFILVSNGCGNANEEKLLPVVGKVTHDGKPLTTGTISLRADAGNQGTAEPYAQIDADGNYQLFTKNKPGAPAGNYIVLVVATEPIDPNNPSAAPKSLIDRKYADPSAPVLRLVVEANPKDGQYDLRLTK